MKRKRKIFMALLSITFLSVVLVNSVSQAVSQKAVMPRQIASKVRYVSVKQKWRPTAIKQAEQDPHSICAPYGGRNAEIIGRATESDGRKHVLWKYQRGRSGNTDTDGHFSIEVTTLLAESVCGTSYNPFVDAAITDRIELDTARSLSLQSYQHFIEEDGGIENFQAAFLENLFQRNFDPYERPSFTSVDLWVWKQIGLEVPEDQYVVENIDNNYKYDDSGSFGF